MRRRTQTHYLLRVVFLLVVCISACGAQQKQSDEDFLMGTNDPFKDPFFSNTEEWDSSVLKQSEVLSKDLPKDPDEPASLVEKTEGALAGAMIIGGGVAKLLFLPFLGL